MTVDTAGAETATGSVQPEAPAPVPNDVRERCRSLGVTRTALAELTGLTPAKIWRVE